MPEQLRYGLEHPEMLDRLYDTQVREWVRRRAEMGFELVSKPLPPYMTPCLDWKEEAGSQWVVVGARFRHHGSQGELTGDDMQEMKDYAESIGAELGKQRKSAGVAKYLEAMTPEDAAATVQAMAPRKEHDDDD